MDQDCIMSPDISKLVPKLHENRRAGGLKEWHNVMDAWLLETGRAHGVGRVAVH